MTNPNDAVGTNGAYGGRTSVNAFNDLAGAFTRGVVSGWACVPNTGLTVSLGGDGTNRDVAIAMDNIGDKTTINNISGAPIDVTIDSAPVSNSRIDLIVAYVDNPPQGTDTVADNPSACGLIVVKGVASASPTPPSNGDIRSAITADGASGTNAYYVVLAQITIASGTTTLTSSNISNGSKAKLNNSNLPQINSSNIDLASIGLDYSTIEQDTGAKWVDGKTIYKKTINFGALPNNNIKDVAHGISNFGWLIKIEGIAKRSAGDGTFFPLPFVSKNSSSNCIEITANNTYIRLEVGIDRTNLTESYITLYYTKTA